MNISIIDKYVHELTLEILRLKYKGVNPLSLKNLENHRNQAIQIQYNYSEKVVPKCLESWTDEL